MKPDTMTAKCILALGGTLMALGAFADATANVTNMISGLDPLTANVFSNFVMLTDIPRPTYHEKAVSDFLFDWAEAHGFSPTQDAQNNVWFDVPATSGMEAMPRTVLQGHMDMVAAGFHDPQNEPVTLDCDAEGHVFSKGHSTSIGSDDGIGIGMAMMVAEGLVPHGPVRVLVTTDEEKTQTGAITVPAAVLQQASYCINIDSETDGEITISSAANDGLTVTGGVTMAAATKPAAYCVSFAGLRGGHSGVDIDKGRVNAIIALAQTLTNAAAHGVSFELAQLTGGDADNAIPPHAQAIILLDNTSPTALEDILADAQAALRARGETAATVKLVATNGITSVFGATSQTKLLDYLTSVHNGIWGWSKDVPGLVETSVNMGVIKATADGIQMLSAARGSAQRPLADEVQSIKDTASRCGYAVEVCRSCAPWPANPANPLVATFSNAWKKVTGKDMRVVALHAGLECGWFSQKAPDLHMVSVGPTIADPHTVNETVSASSVSNGVQLLAKVLATLPAFTPRVQLGVVSQRYPWNGLIDVSYKVDGASSEGCQVMVTLTLPDGREKSELHPARNGVNSATFDAKAAFGAVRVRGAEVRAEAVPATAR